MQLLNTTSKLTHPDLFIETRKFEKAAQKISQRKFERENDKRFKETNVFIKGFSPNLRGITGIKF